MPQPDKILAIERMSTPANKRDIQVFLGMVSYQCRFISNFSKIAQPFFHFLKHKVPFIWSDDCKVLFDLLLKALISAPILAYPNF